ncbi:AT-hook motif nuclear-localized protein 3-like isoform X2 [Asparagus officinalis]|uniref:AT-hook motif nuclear-localized protein 3-like isoform X2 n=1 Tax=Asparagus officinalis TaxID=4686 RepID=UPI00098E4D2A|nr:AT-hook motif nuclear-localized protein 3-like isoform X2 [Asparagus officinalis]
MHLSKYSEIVNHVFPSLEMPDKKNSISICTCLGDKLRWNDNSRGSKIDGLTIMLAGPNGKVFGGRLSGLLIVASSVQVIIGSFASDCHQEPLMGAKKLKLTSVVNHSRNQLDFPLSASGAKEKVGRKKKEPVYDRI